MLDSDFEYFLECRFEELCDEMADIEYIWYERRRINDFVLVDSYKPEYELMCIIISKCLHNKVNKQRFSTNVIPEMHLHPLYFGKVYEWMGDEVFNMV